MNDSLQDFSVSNHGTIFLLQPLTAAANEWIEQNLSEDRQTFGTAVAIEHRFILDVVDGIRNNGLRVI